MNRTRAHIAHSRLARLSLLVIWALPFAATATQDKLPEPPERYGALNAWIRGEIVEVRQSGGVLRLADLGPFGDRRAGGPGSLESALSRGTRRGTWIELRYAKGWVYLDAPDDGPQERLTLREGRKHFRVGQIVEIGRSPGFHGGFDRKGIRLSGAGASAGGGGMTFRGWILLRVSPFREKRKP